MPDMNPNADVIHATASAEENQAAILNYLSSIEHILKNLASGRATSQSAARDAGNTGTQRGSFAQQYDDFYRYRRTKSNSRAYKVTSSFLDGLEEGLLEGLLGSTFKKDLQGVLKKFTDQIGVELKDLPGQLGKQLAKQGMDAFKSTDLGKRVSNTINTYTGKATDFVTNKAASEIRTER